MWGYSRLPGRWITRQYKAKFLLDTARSTHSCNSTSLLRSRAFATSPRTCRESRAAPEQALAGERRWHSSDFQTRCDRDRPALAKSLQTLSIELSAVGREEEAAARREEANLLRTFERTMSRLGDWLPGIAIGY